MTDIYGKFSGRVGPAVRKETWVDVKSVQPWDPVSPINKTAADNTSLPRNFYSCADKDDHARIRVCAVGKLFCVGCKLNLTMTYHGHYTRAKANTAAIAYSIGQIHEHLRKHQLCMCMVSPCSLYMQHSGSKEGGGTEIDDLVARVLTCIIVVYSGKYSKKDCFCFFRNIS